MLPDASSINNMDICQAGEIDFLNMFHSREIACWRGWASGMYLTYSGLLFATPSVRWEDSNSVTAGTYNKMFDV